MHELDMSNDRANMAYVGQKPWHLLGTELDDTATLEQWMIAAGMEWQVKSADVQYNVEQNTFIKPDNRIFQDRKVLYRSDTQAPLSVVSSDFKVVQPKEVIEFFRDLVANHNMKLSTAGSLFGGRRFWALAELGKDFEVVSGDKVTGNLLLTTAVDGTLNTTAKFVSTRVVCNNTLTIALAEKKANLVKVSHRSQWDPDQAKMDLGLIDASWFKFMDDCRRMASTKISDKKAAKFIGDIIYEDKETLTKFQQGKVEKLMGLYKTGAGADMAKGTLWGVVNAITNQYTHGSGKRDASHQFWDCFYTTGAQIKDKAWQAALEEIA